MFIWEFKAVGLDCENISRKLKVVLRSFDKAEGLNNRGRFDFLEKGGESLIDFL